MSARTVPALALLATALIAGGCARTETSPATVTTTSPAGVRVVHAVPSGTSFDLFAGDLLLFDGLGFKTVTPYRAVDGHAGTDAGTVDVRAVDSTAALFDGLAYQAVSDYRDVAPMDGQMQIVSTGQAAPAATTAAHLEPGRFYTLVIVGKAAAPARVEAFLIEDALRP